MARKTYEWAKDIADDLGIGPDEFTKVTKITIDPWGIKVESKIDWKTRTSHSTIYDVDGSFNRGASGRALAERGVQYAKAIKAAEKAGLISG